MKKKILFIVDWPDSFKNMNELQKSLDKDYSENYEWKVWSCKKENSESLLYRWICYLKGALYAIKNRKKYHVIFIWQQMVGYILFELMKFLKLKIPDIVFYTFIYNSNTIFKNYQKYMVQEALIYTKGIIWPSSEMASDVKKDFPKFESKNHFALMPLMDIIDVNVPVTKELDDPYFRNGVYSAGKSERDFDIVIRAFRNTDIPVTIVCPDDHIINETNITSNIRILRFSQVNHEQYYALEGQAFCVLISVTNEVSACGMLTITVAMSNSKPIIATNCWGVRDYIINNKNGILFNVGDSESILLGYERLKNDEKFRNDLVNSAQKTVEEMSLDNFVKKIIKIVEN